MMSESPFRELLIIRHAKSDWSDPDMDDRSRPLSEKGKRQACRMGHWLAERNLIPNLIVSASDRRSRQTLSRLTRHWDASPAIETLEALYRSDDASGEALCAAIRELLTRCDARRVACIGHSESLEPLVTCLTGREEPLSTCAIAHIALPEQAIRRGIRREGMLLNILRPAPKGVSVASPVRAVA